MVADTIQRCPGVQAPSVLCFRCLGLRFLGVADREAALAVERATFDTTELAVVLSHYDVGAIESITPFDRGSSRSPKVGIVAERGKYLLKRRAARRARPERVRFTHAVQTHLVLAGFPVAPLQPTRDGRRTIVQQREHIYELFLFVPGRTFERTVPQARAAGAILAQFHAAVASFVLPDGLPAPRGDYHDNTIVRTGLCSIGSSLTSHDSFSGDEAELAGIVQFLLERYDDAAQAVKSFRSLSDAEAVVHADWHPGNLLFRDDHVVAVVDYDSVRFARPLIDVANGALQFSMTGEGDPAGWPTEQDEDRLTAFLDGYASVVSLTPDERACVPHMMAEALISECVGPIAATGSVGPWSGFRVLKMVRRKLGWMESNLPRMMQPTQLDT